MIHLTTVSVDCVWNDFCAKRLQMLCRRVRGEGRICLRAKLKSALN